MSVECRRNVNGMSVDCWWILGGLAKSSREKQRERHNSQKKIKKGKKKKTLRIQHLGREKKTIYKTTIIIIT